LVLLQESNYRRPTAPLALAYLKSLPNPEVEVEPEQAEQAEQPEPEVEVEQPEVVGGGIFDDMMAHVRYTDAAELLDVGVSSQVSVISEARTDVSASPSVIKLGEGTVEIFRIILLLNTQAYINFDWKPVNTGDT
jgi:hypothetical protein